MDKELPAHITNEPPLPELNYIASEEVDVDVDIPVVPDEELPGISIKAKKDLELSKRGLAILSKVVESYRKSQKSQLQLQKEKLEWEKWKDMAKAAGWVWERLEEES